MITMLSALSFILGGKERKWLTFSLKCVLTFSGSISSSDVCMFFSFCVFLHASTIDFRLQKIQLCNDPSFVFKFLGLSFELSSLNVPDALQVHSDLNLL